MRRINIRPWRRKNVEWTVWEPDSGETEDDARTVLAPSAEQAAADFGEWQDRQGDYTIIRGTSATVLVRSADGGVVFTFKVNGESLPHYTARQLRDQAAADPGNPVLQAADAFNGRKAGAP